MAKSTRPIIRIHDTSTDEVIDREMNDAEFATYEAEKVLATQKQSEQNAHEAAKLAILNRIGLTADELKTILG